jgi:hypothetical protein
MKTICLFSAFAISVLTAAAQVKIIKPGASLSKINGPKAKIIGTSAFGTVYALPQDNMPCLVPNTAKLAIMPVMRTPLKSPGIPNSIGRQDLLATAFPLKNNFKPAKFEFERSNNLMLDLVKKK